MAMVPRPSPRALALDRITRPVWRALLELKADGVARALRTTGPSGTGKAVEVLALCSINAGPHLLQAAPAPNVLKHHLTIMRVLVGPVDHHWVAADLLTWCLLELNVKDAGVSSSDSLESFHDAVEVIGSTCSTITDHDNSGSFLPWRPRSSLVIQGHQPVAFSTMLASIETRIGITDGAMEAIPQVGRQDWISDASHWTVRILALCTDQVVVCGPHRHVALDHLSARVGRRAAAT